MRNVTALAARFGPVTFPGDIREGVKRMQQPPNTHVAQLNVARALDEMDSPRLADFMAALDRVNALAE